MSVSLKSVFVGVGLSLLVLGNCLADDIQRYPDVIKVDVNERSQGWVISATISSLYDTPKRYADAFRVVTDDGEELGVRVLLHDHAYEQPFTRSLTGVKIPAGIKVIWVQGRDKSFGWGGQVVRYELTSGRQETRDQLP